MRKVEFEKRDNILLVTCIEINDNGDEKIISISNLTPVFTKAGRPDKHLSRLMENSIRFLEIDYTQL